MDYSKIKNILRNFITPREKYCFISTLCWGLATHLYFFTNSLYNHDSLCVFVAGTGANLSIGRWFLKVLGDLTGKYSLHYNVPFFTGLLVIFLIACSCILIIKVFDIKNKYFCAILGGITIVFPTITSTLSYSFTVGYYIVAVFLTALGIYLIHNFKKIGFVLGSLLFAHAIGIYQGYLPFSITIFVIIIMKMCVDSEHTFIETFKTGLKFVGSLISGYVFYRLFLTFYLNYYNMSLDSYQGIDKMGVLTLSQLIDGVKSAFLSFIYILNQNYCSVSGSLLLQRGFLFLYIIIGFSFIFLTLHSLKNKENIYKSLLLCILIPIFPIAVNFMVIMSPSSTNALTQFAFVCIFYLAIVLVDYISENHNLQSSIFKLNTIIVKNVLFYLTFTVITTSCLVYCYQSNVNYRHMDYNVKRIELYFETMVSRITSAPNYSDDLSICLVGQTITDNNFNWDPYRPTFYYDGMTVGHNSYSRYNFLTYILGYAHKTININSDEYLEYEEEILSMNTYPNDNSIKVVDDKILIRLE